MLDPEELQPEGNERCKAERGVTIFIIGDISRPAVFPGRILSVLDLPGS